MISRKVDNFTGYVLQESKKVYFHFQDKIFNFVSEEVGIVAEYPKKILKSPDLFLHGYTSDGFQLAIYTGYKEREISANYKIKPGTFIVSRANMCQYDMTKFQVVEFIGGTLNNLYQQKTVTTTYDEKEQCYIKTYPMIEQEYEIKIKELNCKLIIRTIPSKKIPSQMDLVVRYKFEQEIPLNSIKTIYSTLIKICRFMTNRKNVGFDKIKLYQFNQEQNYWENFADGYLDYSYENFTEKSFRNNILFEQLSDCIENIHSIASSDQERKATWLFEFWADMDSDYTVLSDEKIKSICSSVECELDFIKDLKNDENANLTGLISEIKRIIIEHKKSPNKLEDKTYDMIMGSMAHWEMANSRRIYLLYEKQKEYMDILKRKCDLACSEEDITSFVKYRNDITHGRNRTLDSVVATSAYTLMALTYCCFLLRMGISSDNLKLLFEENRIAS